MNPFSDFMAGNAEQIPNQKIIASTRFKDKNGQPLEWEIRAITSDENEEIQRASMRTVSVSRGKQTKEVDNMVFVYKMAVAATVYPDLNNAELQDSYGVKTPEQLLKKMLYPQEFDRYAQAILDMAGVESLEDLRKEAKN